MGAKDCASPRGAAKEGALSPSTPREDSRIAAGEHRATRTLPVDLAAERIYDLRRPTVVQVGQFQRVRAIPKGQTPFRRGSESFFHFLRLCFLEELVHGGYGTSA